MTIDRSEPERPVAVCDQCGERRDIDVGPEENAAEDRLALIRLGWKRHAPERHTFPGYPRVHAIYSQDFCGDCEAGGERPHPRFGSGRKPAAGRDAFANDPCDEWPRRLVFEAAGCRPDCGHPNDGKFGECAYCKAGYAIGRTSRL